LKKQAKTESIKTTSKEIDPEEMSPEEINLEEIARRHDWREILKGVVEKEDMDPWDIKLSKLVQEYIQTVKKLQKMDFKVPANALLASSILLRKKSSSWKLKEDEEEGEFIYWEEIPTTPDQIPPAREEIPEPKPQKRKTQRKVSVDELIDAVEDVIDQEKQKAREKVKEEKTPAQDIVPDHLLEIAKRNTQDFEEKTEELEQKIKQEIDEENLTTFTELIEKDQEQTEREIVKILIPLLHLANQGKISIWQEEIFGEIFIHYPEEREEGEE